MKKYTVNAKHKKIITLIRMPTICFHNVLTEFKVMLSASEADIIETVIRDQLLKFNINAFAYKLNYMGNELNSKLSFGENGIRFNDTDFPNVGDDDRHVPTILMIFPVD